MEEYLYTVDEVASILKVNKNTVYDLIRSGNLIALKLGRLKITKATLLKFLKDFNGKDLTNLENIKELTF
ncbi:helix-turn-helix domain-containing protein [Clostridium botulinum]|nr:helix-turn-helix domain-containing protein [Clostridium botulinum]